MDTQIINKYKWLHIYGRGFDSRRLHQINKKGLPSFGSPFLFLHTVPAYSVAFPCSPECATFGGGWLAW